MQPLKDFVLEAQDVPIKSVQHRDRAVREAMHLLQGDLFAVELAQNGASARRPEIVGEVACRLSHLSVEFPVVFRASGRDI